MKSLNHLVLTKKFDRFTYVYAKYFELIGENQADYLLSYRRLATRILNTRGNRNGVQVLKLLYNECIYYSLGVTTSSITNPWLKRDKTGFPVILKSFKKGLKTNQARTILTIFRSYESIELAPLPDLSSIIEPSEGGVRYKMFLRAEFSAFIKNSRYSYYISKLFSKYLKIEREKNKKNYYHYTTKRGIEGFSLLTAGKQSLAIQGELKSYIEELCAYLGREEYKADLEANQLTYKTSNDFMKTTKITEEYTGRVTFVAAPGGKTRLVAIGNYWIQDALLGVHNILFSVLRSISCDGLYNQQRQAERVRLVTQSGVDVWSYDLTTATDRFPITPQVDVLSGLDSKIGELWEKILKVLKFYYDGKEVRYAVGQPMGLYSSWAVFSITHHFVIQFAAYMRGKKYPFDKYALLGDDVAIWDRDVAVTYRAIIQCLEIPISDAKSFYPERYQLSDKGVIAEFAKRLFVSGIEVTPIPPEVIFESIGNSYELLEFMDFLWDRGILRIPLPVSKIQRVLGLNSLNTLYLCLGLRIKQTLGAQLRGDPDICDESRTNSITIKSILKLRLEELTIQISSLMSDLFDIEEDIESVLDKVSGEGSKDRVIVSRVYNTLLKRVIELSDRLTHLIPDSEFEMETDVLEDLTLEEISLELDQIEYVPIVKPLEIIQEYKGPVRSRTLRGKFIQKLAAELVQQTDS